MARIKGNQGPCAQWRRGFSNHRFRWLICACWGDMGCKFLRRCGAQQQGETHRVRMPCIHHRPLNHHGRGQIQAQPPPTCTRCGAKRDRLCAIRSIKPIGQILRLYPCQINNQPHRIVAQTQPIGGGTIKTKLHLNPLASIRDIAFA